MTLKKFLAKITKNVYNYLCQDIVVQTKNADDKFVYKIKPKVTNKKYVTVYMIARFLLFL